jgi:hypothetical protein
MFSFLYKTKPLLIVAGIVAVIFLTNDGSSSSSSIGSDKQDQSTQTDSLLTEYIVVEYV